MSSDCDFPGFGRIIERSETDELEVAASDVQAASKLLGLNSPTGQSHCSMSTGRNLTGRSEDETHAGVSADEAQMICKSVLSELLAETPAETVVQNVKPPSLAQSTAVPGVPKLHFKPQSRSQASMHEPVFGVDLARVKVIACEVGCIMGMLEWCGPCADGSTERVIFSLLQIRPGYAVVGECSEGPKLLSSLCWKLQSTNGRLDVNVAAIRRGDVLMLEGPRWATRRLMEATPASASSGVRQLQDSKDEESADVLHDLAALADASSKLLALSEMDDEPPLLRPTAMPQLAFPSLSQRTTLESGRSFLKDSMRTPQEVGRGTTLMHSMRTPKESDRSKDTKRSWELGSDINSAVRPFVPTLDFSAISQLRKERLQRNWVPVTPKESQEELPAMTPTLSHPSQRTHNVCIDPSGCSLGFVECKMVAPGGPVSKAMPQGL